MMRLKSKLLSLNNEKVNKVKIFSPANTEELRIPFRLPKTARVVGSLADQPPPTSPDDERLMNGVLVSNDFKLSLMAPEDLREYAGLNTTTVMCRQRLTLASASIDLIKWALEGTFGAIEEITPKAKISVNGTSNGTSHSEDDIDCTVAHSPDGVAYMIMGSVLVRYLGTTGEVTVEWEGNVLNDGIADAVLAVLFSVESSPAAVKQSDSTHRHHTHGHHNLHANVTPEQRIEQPKVVFKEVKKEEQKVGIVKKEEDEEEMSAEAIADAEAEELERLHSIGVPVPGVEIRVDKLVAKVWLETLEVECSNATLRDRVKAVVERAVETVAPLWVGRKR